MRRVLVVAPHPDDETLGCGGALLRHKDQGDKVHWLIVTRRRQREGFSRAEIELFRRAVPKAVSQYRFAGVHQLGYPTTTLDTIATREIIGKIGEVFKKVTPEVLYIPFGGDVHTDHRIVSEATIACAKWFRYPSIKRILAYEVISETDFGISAHLNGFRPNVFIDITGYLAKKIQIMKLYATEGGVFPFPRSREAIRVLAMSRGAAAGFKAAEAFMLLKEIL